MCKMEEDYQELGNEDTLYYFICNVARTPWLVKNDKWKVLQERCDLLWCGRGGMRDVASSHWFCIIDVIFFTHFSCFIYYSLRVFLLRFYSFVPESFLLDVFFFSLLRSLYVFLSCLVQGLAHWIVAVWMSFINVGNMIPCLVMVEAVLVLTNLKQRIREIWFDIIVIRKLHPDSCSACLITSMYQFSWYLEVSKFSWNFQGYTLRLFLINHVLWYYSKSMRFTNNKYIIVKKEQETPVLMRYSEIKLEYKYRCKNGESYIFVFF